MTTRELQDVLAKELETLGPTEVTHALGVALLDYVMQHNPYRVLREENPISPFTLGEATRYSILAMAVWNAVELCRTMQEIKGDET